jgi:tetratricopeptide (TPR) repeat protein
MRLTPDQRDWQRLEEVLQRAAAAIPDSWEIPLVRANLLVLRDADAGVGQAMQILLSQEQIHPGSVGLWSNLVFLYERMGLADEAERALQHLKSLQPHSAQPLAWEAALQAARGNFAAAESALKDAPAAPNEADQEWLDRARLLLAYQKGDLAQIRRELLRIQSERPQGTHVLAQLADLALAEGNWTECDRWVSQLRAAEGADGVWWRFFEARRLLASDAALKPETLSKAMTRHEEIRRLRPWWPGASMLRGMLAEAQGAPAEAAEAYALAVRSGFHQPHVYERLIRSLYEQGRFDEANQWLAQFQQAAPLDVRLLDLAWTTALQRNQSELAVRMARQNLERHPDQPSAHVWLAQMLVISGDREEADRIIQAARRLQPDDLASWTGLLAYDLHRGRADEARRDLEVLANHPDLPAAKFHTLAAYAYQQLGDRAAADEHYRRGLEASPDDVDLRVRFATFLHPFDPAQAESELRDVLSRVPGHVNARRSLATWLHSRDDEALQVEARELLQTSDGSWHQQAADRRLEAVLLVRRGKPDDLQSAEMLLEQLVDDVSQASPSDRLLLGRVYERRGNLIAAEEQLKTLAHSTPETAQHIAVYVDFLLRRRRLEDARVYLERLERQAPMSLTAVSLRSRFLLASGRTEEIDGYLESFAQRQLAQLRDALQRQQFMRQVAGLFAAVERQAAAERWYRRLVAEYPDQREALANFLLERDQVPDSLEFAFNEVQQATTPATAALLARVMVQGDLDPEQVQRAETVFQEVLASYPDDARFLFSLASLRLKQNDMAAAESMLRKLTAGHPEHVTAWNNLAAILADDPARLDEALASIDRAIAAAGRPVANLLDTKAVILLQLDRNAEAAELLQRVLARADATDSRFHFHYAVAQLRLGDAAQARQAWRRAQELGLAKSYLTRYEQQLMSDLSSTFEGAAAGS